MSVEASGIVAAYGGRVVLDGLNFLARPGEVTAIVGPNGSGKSTLLKTISGDIPHQGTVRINGCETRMMKPWELAACRGVLPQASELAFPFTALEVVQIGLQAGIDARRSELPLQALARVGLSGYAERLFQDLSGGEQQRVQLARVLAQVWDPVDAQGAPRWMFLDEPVSSLDIAHQLQIMQTARDYADAGGGIVAVMHDLNLTALYADRVMVMAAGRCLAADTPQAVMTDAILARAYGCNLAVNKVPQGSVPFVLPHAADAL